MVPSFFFVWKDQVLISAVPYEERSRLNGLSTGLCKKFRCGSVRSLVRREEVLDASELKAGDFFCKVRFRKEGELYRMGVALSHDHIFDSPNGFVFVTVHNKNHGTP